MCSDVDSYLDSEEDSILSTDLDDDIDSLDDEEAILTEKKIS